MQILTACKHYSTDPVIMSAARVSSILPGLGLLSSWRGHVDPSSIKPDNISSQGGQYEHVGTTTSFRESIKLRIFGSPTRASYPPTDYLRPDQDPLAMTIDDLAGLSFQDRVAWVRWLMERTGAPKFTNFVGMIKYFDREPRFADLAGWVSVVDACIIQSVQDGYRIHQGLEPIGHQITLPNGEIVPIHAGEGWAEFYTLYKAGHMNRANTQWGVAEIAGVDYGKRVAEPIYREASDDSKSLIDWLLLCGDAYRQIKAAGWDQSGPTGMVLSSLMSADNRRSEAFVRVFSHVVISGGHSVYHYFK